jgi:hypothetical protein
MEIPQPKQTQPGRQETSDTNFSVPSDKRETQELAIGDPNEMTVRPHRVLPHMGGKRVYQQPAEENVPANNPPEENPVQETAPEQKQVNQTPTQSGIAIEESKNRSIQT